MGGFRAQTYEFHKNNQDVIKENEFIYVNIHQDGIYKVLKNEVDVAFVRDGIYEKMLANKTLDANDVKIINEQKIQIIHSKYQLLFILNGLYLPFQTLIKKM